jgi:hypothetical protein
MPTSPAIASASALTKAIKRVKDRQLQFQGVGIRQVEQEETMEDRPKARRLRTHRTVPADISLADDERKVMQSWIAKSVFL